MIYVWSHHVANTILTLLEALWTLVSLPFVLFRRPSSEDLKINWTFDGTWPYKANYFDTPEGRVHYVDEGPQGGKPIVMIHGNPTWGYLYRKFISTFSKQGYRCIVPDHLGYGRSDKPSHPDFYRYEKHCERLNALLISLKLSNVTLILQDWGGPVGIAYAHDHPSCVETLIVLNTLCQGTRSPLHLHGFLQYVRTPVIGELLVQGLNATIEKFLFNKGVARPENLSDVVKTAYRAPFRHWRDRVAMVQFPRQISEKSTDPVSLKLFKYEKALKNFDSSDVLIVWPTCDPGFTMKLLDEYWRADFPRSKVVLVERASHYIQEDAPAEVISEISLFLAERDR